MKVTLNGIGSLIDTTTAGTALNANNQLIENAFNNTLSLDGTQPNQMKSDIDMNSQQIINLPQPATAQSPLRLQDLDTFIGGGTITNIPAGGTSGQLLGKNSSNNYDVSWIGLSPTDIVGGTNITTTGNNPTTIATTSTPTFTSLTIGSTAENFPASGNIVGTTDTQTLTNKTLVAPVLGTPASGIATNLTGTASGLTAGNVTTNANLTGMVTSVGNAASLGSFTSANLRTALTDETGTGAAVFAGGALGAATATSINGSTVSPGHYSGEPSTGSAAAGEIGEYVQGDLLGGSKISLTSGTPATVVSISLSAGDWDVLGFVNLTPAATTNMVSAALTISLVNNTFDFTAFRWNQVVSPTSSGTVYNNNFNLNTPVARISLSSTTTVYLVIGANFTISTMQAYGSIRARRAR